MGGHGINERGDGREIWGWEHRRMKQKSRGMGKKGRTQKGRKGNRTKGWKAEGERKKG